MCRWFAYISPSEECLLEDVLITPAHGLSKQVNDHYLPKLISHLPGQETSKDEIALRNLVNNNDGFGVAWYTGARSGFVTATEGQQPCLFRHSEPPQNNENFHNLCSNVATTCLFAHIRASSGSAITYINNHPFVFGRHTIMHNGTVSNFLDIRRDLLEMVENSLYKQIRGTTDSELIGALYMTYLTASDPGPASWNKRYTVSQMNAALTKAFAAVIKLQQKIVGSDKSTPNSLNVACTDGNQMVAFRFRNHAVEQPPSLYYSTTAGMTLNRKYPDDPNGPDIINANAYKSASEHGKHLIVASEPTTYNEKEWELIPKNHAVLVNANGDFKTVEIELGEEYEAKVGNLVHM